MLQVTPKIPLAKILKEGRAAAFAKISGDEVYPSLRGMVYFYQIPVRGLLIEAEVFGLPDRGSLDAPAFYAFHIHEIGDCSKHFENTKGHYNPNAMPHPMHFGDMPPLMSYHGYAWCAFYDAGLQLYDVLDRSVIIHSNADDFTTQPSGNAGEKIACGVIHAARQETLEAFW